MSQPPKTSKIHDTQAKASGYKYQIDFDGATGEVTWDPPKGSSGLIRALAVNFPEQGSTRDRMSVALAQYFDQHAQQDGTSSTYQSTTTLEAQQHYPSSPLGSDSDRSSMDPRATSPTASRIHTKRRRHLTNAGADDARINRRNNATCEHHRVTKTKCDRLRCTMNELYRQPQLELQSASSNLKQAISVASSPTADENFPHPENGEIMGQPIMPPSFGIHFEQYSSPAVQNANQNYENYTPIPMPLWSADSFQANNHLVMESQCIQVVTPPHMYECHPSNGNMGYNPFPPPAPSQQQFLGFTFLPQPEGPLPQQTLIPIEAINESSFIPRGGITRPNTWTQKHHQDQTSDTAGSNLNDKEKGVDSVIRSLGDLTLDEKGRGKELGRKNV